MGLWFFDLEETLIESWDRPVIINQSDISWFIDTHQIKEIQIFSFAIQTDHDKAKFESLLKKRIEHAFDIKITNVVTIEQMRAAHFKIHNLGFEDDFEFIGCVKKFGAFLSWCALHHPDALSAALIDDTVDNITVWNRRTGQTIDFIDVANIEQ